MDGDRWRRGMAQLAGAVRFRFDAKGASNDDLDLLGRLALLVHPSLSLRHDSSDGVLPSGSLPSNAWTLIEDASTRLPAAIARPQQGMRRLRQSVEQRRLFPCAFRALCPSSPE